MKVVPDISMRAALKNKKARENAMFSLAFLVRWLQFGYFLSDILNLCTLLIYRIVQLTISKVNFIDIFS